MNWVVEFGAGKKRNVLYWPETADWNHPEKIRGGNPILFPFVARSFCKGKEGNWQPKGHPVLPVPRHGFARGGQFELESCSQTGFVARLVPTTQDIESYPFSYIFRVSYEFEELGFKTQLSLENQGTENIPWCAGHHFYFSLPWHTGLERKDYVLNLSAKKAFYHGATGALVAAPKPEESENIGNPVLLDRLHTHLKNPFVSFGPKSGEEKITIRIGEGPVPTPWTTITTWTENEKSPFFCIEPWMGPPNAFEHEKGLHWVEPGQIETFSVKIQLD